MVTNEKKHSYSGQLLLTAPDRSKKIQSFEKRVIGKKQGFGLLQRVKICSVFLLPFIGRVLDLDSQGCGVFDSQLNLNLNFPTIKNVIKLKNDFHFTEVGQLRITKA